MIKTAHDPIICKRDTQGTQYVGKGYRSEFICPVCARSCWQHMSFLGRRNVVCNGVKFTKEAKSVPVATCELCGKPAVPYTPCINDDIAHDVED